MANSERKKTPPPNGIGTPTATATATASGAVNPQEQKKSQLSSLLESKNDGGYSRQENAIVISIKVAVQAGYLEDNWVFMTNLRGRLAGTSKKFAAFASSDYFKRIDQQYQQAIRGYKILRPLFPEKEGKVNPAERKSTLPARKTVVPEQISTAFACVNGVTALAEGLVTIAQIQKIPNQYYGVRSYRYIERDPEEKEDKRKEKGDADPNHEETVLRIRILFLPTHFGLDALRAGFTLDQALRFKFSYNLEAYLRWKSGVIAVQGKLITLKDVEHFPHPGRLAVMLSKEGLSALQDRFIRWDQVRNIDRHLLALLVSPWGRRIINERHMTFQQASQLKSTGRYSFEPGVAPYILSEQGHVALSQRLFTVDQMTYLGPENLKVVMTPKGLDARRRFFTAQQMMDLKGLDRYEHKLHDFHDSDGYRPLKYMLSDDGLRVIEAANLTGDWLVRLAIYPDHGASWSDKVCHGIVHPHHLPLLFSRNFYVALREKVLTVDKAVTYYSDTLKELITDDALSAFREKFITLEEIDSAIKKCEGESRFPHSKAITKALVSKHCREAVQKGYIKRDALLTKENLQFAPFMFSEAGIKAFNSGLTLEQFRQLHFLCEMYSNWEYVLQLFVDKLVSFEQLLLLNGHEGFEARSLLGYHREIIAALQNKEITFDILLQNAKREVTNRFKDDGHSNNAKYFLINLKLQRLGITGSLPDILNGLLARITQAEAKEVKTVVVESAPKQKSPEEWKQQYAEEGKERQQKEMAQKADAFEKIYNALRDGQSNLIFYKTDFMADKRMLTPEELINRINEHIRENPDSRTAKAWELAQLHYEDYSRENRTLFRAIYKYAYEHSHIFSKSCVMGITFYRSSSLNAMLDREFPTVENIEANAQRNTRTAAIVKNLKIRGG